MKTRAKTRAKGFTLVELMVVIAILGLLASVLATSVVTQMRAATKQLDKKVMHDLYDQIQMVVALPDNRTRRLLVTGELAEAQGREFYEGLFKHRLLGEDMLPKLVSHSGDDFEADRRELDHADSFFLHPSHCSWTGPQGNECLRLMGLRGERRRVVMSYNERNWFNQDREILTMWSDGQVAEYVTRLELQDWGYEIDAAQWDSPAAEIFGRVRPFDGVFE